jgi:arylsulfatase A-like enzyme
MSGSPAMVDKCKKGYKAGDKTFKVHIDGFNLVDFLTTAGVKSPRDFFFYFSDDGDLTALRYKNWKMAFAEQRCQGTLRIWAEPFTTLRVPKLFNLRTDPYERADITSNTYWDWYMSKAYLIMGAQHVVSRFLETFKAFPPRQKAASFTIDQVMEKMTTAAEAGR